MGNCVSCNSDNTPISAETAEERHREKLEKLEDDVFEEYYTDRAITHINQILTSFNRAKGNDYATAVHSLTNVGLAQPCADSIRYLHQMKGVSRYCLPI